MKPKLQQIRMAWLLAALFVAVRLLYALVFNGLASGQTVLVSLPQFRLPGIFSHISLLGPVTLEAIISTSSFAIPFALGIGISGSLFALVSPRLIFEAASKARVFKPLLTAMAIGWAQLPSLIQSIKRIEQARKLRGERRHRMLIPILETAVERAMAAAERLALISSVTSGEGLSVRKLVFRNPDVGPIDFDLQPGQILVISGPTGSGKTTLLRTLAGLNTSLVQGEISKLSPIGYLPQQPRNSIWGPLVRDEISAPRLFPLAQKLLSSTADLSEGEAVQLVIERELAKNPRLLILDEPLSALDEVAREQLIQGLRGYLECGGIAIAVEHTPELYQPLNPRFLQLADGKLHPGRFEPNATEISRLPMVVGGERIASFELGDVGFGDRQLIRDVVLEPHQSQAIAIHGPNGSGKTTLLNSLLIAAKEQHAVMVPELVTDFFVTTSVKDELTRADKIAGAKEGLTLENLRSILPSLPFELDVHPRDISQGSQLALAIAMQLSHKPNLLLLDEPVKGFDPSLRANVSQTLKCVLETGCAVIFATHDAAFAEELADSSFEIRDQRLIEAKRVIA